MCAACAYEYKDPLNRRFHAEPNACPECGPVIRIFDQVGRLIEALSPVEKAMALLSSGCILAIKGLGGFHLSVDAGNREAVRRLRNRKFREEKPLAIMVRDLAHAKRIAEIGLREEKLLLSPERPIVLVRKKDTGLVAPEVAPGVCNYGIMLPYTPLHHILIRGDFAALVMTSANQVDEPICIGNREAMERLRGIADAFLVHNRDILVRCDDSVAHVVANAPRMLRRSRGYAPKPIALKDHYPGVLALGPHLKGTVCILKGNYAFLSPHVGDLETPQARDFLQESISLMKKITESDPSIVACDLHPGYFSTRLALGHNRTDVVRVQHHHAHIVSCMAENKISGDVIGLAMDGTGYGTDGNAWGGEILAACETVFTRKGHIRYFLLPGGKKAVHEPWRIAVSLLKEAFGPSWPALASQLKLVPNDRSIPVLEKMLETGINSPFTSGLGRIFDGIGSLLGLRQAVTFEGQAAMGLEELACEGAGEPFPFAIEDGPEGIFFLDFRPTVCAVVDGLVKKKERKELAYSFHRTLHKAFLAASERVRTQTGLNRVVLSGGCFQNRILLEGCIRELESSSFEVFSHRLVPANDGGVSLGQAVVAGAKRSAEGRRLESDD